MPNPLQSVKGKVFRNTSTKEVLGTIRPLAAAEKRTTLSGVHLDAIADDDSGNSFVIGNDGAVSFWDHETDEVTRLADSVPEFAAACEEPEPVELKPGQVKSVWIDPAFAKSLGRNVPPDGWVKKKEGK
jgi:hypothetical protein